MHNYQHFEHDHLSDRLDDSILHNIGGHGGHGGGAFGGGGFHAPTSVPYAPALPITPHTPVVPPIPALSPTARHIAGVRSFYRHHPYGGNFGHRSFGFSPYGRRWWQNGGGWLFGYDYNFWYPFFYDLDSGVYDEYYLRQKYDLTDAQWNDLITKLINGKYISFNY